MKDVTRSLLVIAVILLAFGLSYIAFDHIDNAYMHNEPQYVKELENENDSLKTLVRNTRNLNEDLEDKIEDLEDELDKFKGDNTDEENGGDNDE